MANMDDFANELEALVADTEPQQASASAAAQPVNEPITDPVFQADAWGQYHREQRLAYQQAQTGKPPGAYPQRPQQAWNPAVWKAPAYYGATQAGQQGQQAYQGYQAPFGQPGVAPPANPQLQFGQARWPPPAEAAPAEIPGLVFPQATTRSSAPLREPGRVVLSGVPGGEVGDELLRRMLGPGPIAMEHP